MRQRLGIVFVVRVFVVSFVIPCALQAEGAERYRFTGGKWFDGQTFIERTMCSARQWFVECGGSEFAKSTEPTDTVDLAGGFVVPPFGDAHTHNFSAPDSAIVDRYLADGVFYVQVLNNTTSTLTEVRPRVNRRDSVDVVFANGGLTSTHSHPAVLYEALALGIYTPAEKQRRAAEIRSGRTAHRDGYWLIDHRDQLEPVWQAFLDTAPELVKIYLTDAVAGQERAVPETGLQPELVPEIVDRARRVGLPVYAHADSVEDFRFALRAGVDGFAHLPGVPAAKKGQPEGLSEADLALVRKRRTIVIPTAAIFLKSPYGPPAPESLREYFKEQLRSLHRAGARLVIGADNWLQTSVPEAMALHELEVFDELTLLRMWSESTPQVIFPKRRIGRLRIGYEASFLVLEGNPLEDFSQTQRISSRVKQGLVLKSALGQTGSGEAGSP